MQVEMGALPEGYCPANLQDYANAIASRLIVTPSSNFTSFAAGSVAPTSNVGPWFKDCESWFVWDDNLAMYIPMTKGGFDNQQYFSTSQAWVVPEFIYKIKVTAWGAGGGGSDSVGGNNGAGGGGGAMGSKIIGVNPFDAITMVIGSGGANGNPSGADGGNTTVATPSGIFLTCTGGKGATASAGAAGGTSTGGDINLAGQCGWGILNSAAGVGGDAGGWGGKGGTVSTVVGNRAGLAPGGGGSGGEGGYVSDLGGAGASGGVFIEW